MVKIVSKSGKELDVSLDFDKICEYEEAHPGWSLMGEIANVKTMRFTSIRLLTSFFYDGGWPAFAKDGFDLNDMSKVILDGLTELGFTPGDSSPE